MELRTLWNMAKNTATMLFLFGVLAAPVAYGSMWYTSVNGEIAKIPVLVTDVAVLKQDVAVLKQDVAILKQDVAEMKNEIGILKQNVDVLNDKMDIIIDRLNVQQTGQKPAVHNTQAQ